MGAPGPFSEGAVQGGHAGECPEPAVPGQVSIQLLKGRLRPHPPSLRTVSLPITADRAPKPRTRTMAHGSQSSSSQDCVTWRSAFLAKAASCGANSNFPFCHKLLGLVNSFMHDLQRPEGLPITPPATRPHHFPLQLRGHEQGASPCAPASG
ncbi:uncharacterized protein LOC111720182 isoform X2 [Sarcophilus harrisii]|uniref:uncharacterized protein LOC111720182 isoform X2 n=1 Tax=Sarcophilus harrisii TaxID=9305 RepID=UPI001301FA46|nr:uncharacterized protein LOC111720182 isoform X2 [Sarcophilus harrisii]